MPEQEMLGFMAFSKMTDEVPREAMEWWRTYSPEEKLEFTFQAFAPLPEAKA